MPARVGGFSRGQGVCGAREEDVKRHGGARGPPLEGFLHHGSGPGKDQIRAPPFPKHVTGCLD